MTRSFVSRLSRTAVAAVLPLLIAPLPSIAQESLQQIVVAAPPNDSSGSIFYAADLGLYRKAGLNVKVQALNNPGSIAAAVAGGSVQIGALTIPSIAIARQKGLPLVIVAPGSVYSRAAPTSGIIVLSNSPYKKARDLDGKTIATRDLSNLSYYGANNWMDKNGGDSKSVKWIELTDTQTVPALLAGRIDAASVSEPALDGAIQGPYARMLAPIYDAIGDRFLISGEFTTEDFAKTHAEVVRKFAEVIIAAGAWANKNHAQSAKILEKYAGVPVAATATRVTYADRLRPADIQPILDMLQQYGVLKPMRPSELFAAPLATMP